MADGEAQPGTLADRLRGEERIEHVAHDSCGNPLAGIPYLDDRAPRLVGAHRQQDLVVARMSFGNGLRRIRE